MRAKTKEGKGGPNGEDKMGDFYWLPSIKNRGHRPFADIVSQFKPLQVIVGKKERSTGNCFTYRPKSPLDKTNGKVSD